MRSFEDENFGNFFRKKQTSEKNVIFLLTSLSSRDVTLQSGKKWSWLLGSFCAVSAAFADTGAEEENGVFYEAEKPAVRPYIMIIGGLPKSGAHRVSGKLHLGTVRNTGVVGLDGTGLNIPVPAKDQTSKCGFMGLLELGAKYKWVRLGLEFGYIQADTKTSKLAELLGAKTDAEQKAYLAKLFPAHAGAINLIAPGGIEAGLNALTNAKGFGNWNDINTKIRFHQPFGAVNLTLDVPLNKYFTAYVGGGIGACYEVARLHLNNEDKIPFRKMKKLYQCFAGIGVNISEGWSLRGGYRLMRIDNKRYSMKKDNQEIGIEGGGTAKGFEVALMYHF
ncbi:MAG: outer membrane beta-barrel protein [Opitutales bacterium]|nr:outer membrane beta-barrel protein [Opitutales bacterium]